MNNYTQKEHLTLVELLEDEVLELCFTSKSSDEKLFFRNNENEYFSVPHKTHFKGSEIEKMDSLIGFEEKNSKNTLDYFDSWLNYCGDEYSTIDLEVDEKSNTTRKAVESENIERRIFSIDIEKLSKDDTDAILEEIVNKRCKDHYKSIQEALKELNDIQNELRLRLLDKNSEEGDTNQIWKFYEGDFVFVFYDLSLSIWEVVERVDKRGHRRENYILSNKTISRRPTNEENMFKDLYELHVHLKANNIPPDLLKLQIY